MDKVDSHRKESQAIEEFLEWLICGPYRPWRATDKIGDYTAKRKLFIVGEALTIMPQNFEEHTANARLIAAAPALLAAAKDALESLKRLPDAEGAWRITCINQLNRAIEAAEGRG